LVEEANSLVDCVLVGCSLEVEVVCNLEVEENSLGDCALEDCSLEGVEVCSWKEE
jgi:hypothetical protein